MRAIVLAVLAMLCAVPAATTQAEIVPLSQETIPDILTDIPAEFNDTTPGKRVRYEMTLQNQTDRSGVWRLKTEILRPIAFEFRIGPGGDVIFRWDKTYLHQYTRASQGPELVSDPVVLGAGDTLSLTAMFAHPPNGEMFPVRLVPDTVHTAEVVRERMIHGLYFGAQILFVVFFLVFARVLSSPAARSFAAYLMLLAVLNAHSHGYTAAVTDMLGLPYFPMFRILQVAVILAYIGFAMSFLDARQSYPRFAFWIRVYLAVFVVGVVIEMTFGFGWLSVLAGATFLTVGCIAAYVALRDHRDGSWYFTGGFVTLLVVGVVNFFGSETRDPVTNDAIDGLTLFLQLCDAGIFAGAIVAQTRGLRRARDEARDAQLAEYQARLALNERLRQSETETQQARALAEQHRNRLATTSHDLRQPLTSLRVSLDKARDVAPGLADDLSSGIEFLDSVLGETLQDTRPDEDAPRPDTESEAVPVQIVFDNIQRMFAAEAAAKGIDLRVVATSVAVEIAAIDLIRIASNLVSNAVKYTNTGKVLVGVRRQGDRVAIEVWDTGAGVPEDQVGTILDAYQRGTPPVGTTGEGLGLSIAHDLARRNGCAISVHSVAGAGSVFAVTGLVIA